MGLKIRNAPQGKTNYADDGSDWPLISGQSQWMNNTPDDWHTHCEFATAGKLPGGPIWAECGDEAITVPVTIQVREVAGLSGAVVLVWGEYADHTTFPVTMDQPLPLKSNGPTVVTVYTGKATFNLKNSVINGIITPAHGWTGVVLKCRTILTNGDQFDTETVLPVFSVVDPTVPESPMAEGFMQLAAKTTNFLVGGNAVPFGIHLVEMRDQSMPLTEPFSDPTFERVYGYQYSIDPNLPIGLFEYTATLDENAHLIPPIPGIPITTTPFGTNGNFDTLDPLYFSKNPVLPGNAPNQHVVILAWEGETGPNGFTTQNGQKVPGNICYTSVLKVYMFIGSNPQPAPPLTLISVPGVVGQMQDAAEKIIVASGFRVGDVGQNNAPTQFNAGQVWTQDPAPGPQGLPPGTLINIGVAIGGTPPVMVNVPNIVGMTQADATNALVTAQLTTGAITNANDSIVPKGNVISQNPVQGTLVLKGSAVNFVVSLGPVAPPTDTNLGTIVKQSDGNVAVVDNHGNRLILLP